MDTHLKPIIFIATLLVSYVVAGRKFYTILGGLSSNCKGFFSSLQLLRCAWKATLRTVSPTSAWDAFARPALDVTSLPVVLQTGLYVDHF